MLPLRCKFITSATSRIVLGALRVVIHGNKFFVTLGAIFKICWLRFCFLGTELQRSQSLDKYNRWIGPIYRLKMSENRSKSMVL